MLDWLVIGGGPHGIHTALRLLVDGGVPRDAIGILDDEERLMSRWRRATRNTGMKFLRSPGVHHIDLSPGALDRFASRKGRSVKRPFTRPYSRPALELFDRHCDAIIEEYELEALHMRGRANRLDLSSTSATVGFEDPGHEGSPEAVRARQVILAIGAPREPAWPDWALRANAAAADANVAEPHSLIQHIFDPGLELQDDEESTRVAVIGAGISGAQVALRLAREGRQVTLISRHALRVEQFDSDPGWQGPRHMSGFARIQDPNERRDRIRAARNRGSMPRDVFMPLRAALADGTLELIEEERGRSAHVANREVSRALERRDLRVDRVVLATGFPSRRPGGAWLDEAVEAHQLPCAACGYPIVDRGLRWHPRLFVTGALEELELGPVSRNLSGARRAGDRILSVADAPN